MKLQIFILCVTTILLSACGTLKKEDSSQPNLSGKWNFEVPTTGSNVTYGSMVLTPNNGAYQGTLTTNQGNEVLPLQLMLDELNIKMIVKSPQGNVVFVGVLSSSADSFIGKVTYHTGDTFPMSGSKVL